MADSELSADFEALAKPAFTPFADDRRRGSDKFEADWYANSDLFGDNHRRSQIDVQVASIVPEHHQQASHILAGFEHLTNGDTSRVADLTSLLASVEETNIEESTTVVTDPTTHHA